MPHPLPARCRPAPPPPPPPPPTHTTTTASTLLVLSPRRPRPAGPHPHDGLTPPAPVTTTALPRRQLRQSSLDRLCCRHPTAPEQIEMRAAGHDGGGGISNWTEIQGVDVPAVIIAPRAWLTQSLREGVRSSRTCSVAEGMMFV
ncbi:hypothetical protein VPH35_006997 [Triticum aestivum]